eukprot:m.335253 g.335253  ORF g.335253 m.335253 type:complete len:309 (-) comp27767_c0_seq1:1354-2280(-)
MPHGDNRDSVKCLRGLDDDRDDRVVSSPPPTHALPYSGAGAGGECPVHGVNRNLRHFRQSRGPSPRPRRRSSPTTGCRALSACSDDAPRPRPGSPGRARAPGPRSRPRSRWPASRAPARGRSATVPALPPSSRSDRVATRFCSPRRAGRAPRGRSRFGRGCGPPVPRRVFGAGPVSPEGCAPTAAALSTLPAGSRSARAAARGPRPRGPRRAACTGRGRGRPAGSQPRRPSACSPARPPPCGPTVAWDPPASDTAPAPGTAFGRGAVATTAGRCAQPHLCGRRDAPEACATAARGVAASRPALTRCVP